MTIHPDLHPDDTTHRRELIAELRRIRCAAGLSYADLAGILYVLPDAVSQFERSQHRPHIVTVQRHARALGHVADLVLHGIAAPGTADIRTLVAVATTATNPGTADAAARSLCLALLASARRHQGLSRSDVAARLGVRGSSIRTLEAERDEPLLSTYQRYARALGGWLTVELRPVGSERARPPRMNEVLPCPSRSARLRHLARAEHCDTCGVEGKVRLERKEAA